MSSNSQDTSYFNGFTRNSIISIVIFVAVVLFFAFGEYYISSPTEPKQYLFYPETHELGKLRQHEEEVLNSYRVIDESAGVYGIPVERAMDIVLEEADKR